MTKVVMMRGLPASGKTTKSKVATKDFKPTAEVLTKKVN